MDLFEYGMIVYMIVIVMIGFFVRHYSEDNPRFKKAKSVKGKSKKTS